MDRGPRTGVTVDISLFVLDLIKGGGPPAPSAPCQSRKLTEESSFTLPPPFPSSFFVARSIKKDEMKRVLLVY